MVQKHGCNVKIIYFFIFFLPITIFSSIEAPRFFDVPGHSNLEGLPQRREDERPIECFMNDVLIIGFERKDGREAMIRRPLHLVTSAGRVGP